MNTVKKVITVVGYVGTLIGMFLVGKAVGEYYWNHVFTKVWDVEEI